MFILGATILCFLAIGAKALLNATLPKHPQQLSLRNRHLVVIVDGLLGPRYRTGTFRLKWALEAADTHVTCLISTAASPLDTLFGVEHCAQRVAREVAAHWHSLRATRTQLELSGNWSLARYFLLKPYTHISFVGHSMGGRVAAGQCGK